MNSKIELYASICSVLERPEAKKEIWDILAGYTINTLAAYSSLENSIKEFLDAKRADSLSEKSILNYKQILALFQQWKDIPPSLVTTDVIRGWMSYLKEERGMKKDSVQTYLNCLRSFFGWLYSEEKIQSNPTTRIKSAHIDRKKSRKPLTQEEVELCRSVLKNGREKAIFEMYISTGCRLSELVDIKTEDIDFNARELKVCGKGDKMRTVYFSAKAKLAVQAYLAESKNKSILFSCDIAPYGPLGDQAIEKIIRAIGRRAKLSEPLYPHKLRHTFATSALNSGMDIVVIQQLLGHSNLDTTQIYAQLSQESVRHSYCKLVT